MLCPQVSNSCRTYSPLPHRYPPSQRPLAPPTPRAPTCFLYSASLTSARMPRMSCPLNSVTIVSAGIGRRAKMPQPWMPLFPNVMRRGSRDWHTRSLLRHVVLRLPLTDSCCCCCWPGGPAATAAAPVPAAAAPCCCWSPSAPAPAAAPAAAGASPPPAAAAPAVGSPSTGVDARLVSGPAPEDSAGVPGLLLPAPAAAAAAACVEDGSSTACAASHSAAV